MQPGARKVQIKQGGHSTPIRLLGVQSLRPPKSTQPNEPRHPSSRLCPSAWPQRTVGKRTQQHSARVYRVTGPGRMLPTQIAVVSLRREAPTLARGLLFKTRSPMDLLPYQRRVVHEASDLDSRLDKLRAFMKSPYWRALPDDEVRLLISQEDAMAKLSAILHKRIGFFALTS